VQHTSASLTINENYDSDVQADTETFLNRIVPEVSGPIFFSSYLNGQNLILGSLCVHGSQGHNAPWKHTMEG